MLWEFHMFGPFLQKNFQQLCWRRSSPCFVRQNMIGIFSPKTIQNLLSTGSIHKQVMFTAALLRSVRKMMCTRFTICVVNHTRWIWKQRIVTHWWWKALCLYRGKTFIYLVFVWRPAFSNCKLCSCFPQSILLYPLFQVITIFGIQNAIKSCYDLINFRSFISQTFVLVFIFPSDFLLIFFLLTGEYLVQNTKTSLLLLCALSRLLSCRVRSVVNNNICKNF